MPTRHSPMFARRSACFEKCREWENHKRWTKCDVSPNDSVCNLRDGRDRRFPESRRSVDCPLARDFCRPSILVAGNDRLWITCGQQNGVREMNACRLRHTFSTGSRVVCDMEISQHVSLATCFCKGDLQLPTTRRRNVSAFRGGRSPTALVQST